MATLTEDLILSKVKEEKLEQITRLNLTCANLGHIPPELLERLTALKELDVSNNVLENFPRNIVLKKLTSLNISGNQFSSLEFFSNFPKLKELDMEDNNFSGMSSKYIISVKFPHIERVGKSNKDQLMKFVEYYRLKLRPLVRSTWEEDFSGKYAESEIPENAVNKLVDDLVAAVINRKPYGPANMIEFRDLIIRELSQDIVTEVRSGSYEPPLKKAKSGVKSSTYVKKRKRKDFVNKSPSKRFASVDRLPAAPDYDPVNFVRCHFNDREEKESCIDNDPKDEFTKVWVCKFEPDINDPTKTTGAVATCGGNCVCIIDSGSGVVLKRYKQDKEQYYALAWSTIEVTGDAGRTWKTNVLAVGCFRGRLKLLHPEQGVCYADWGKNKPSRRMTGDFFVSNLMFHPRKPTWLFAGSSDASITLWDIGVPSGENMECSQRPLLLFLTPEIDNPIYSLEFSASSDHVVAGCRYGCYAWKVSEKEAEETKTVRKQPVCEIILPGPEKDPAVDSLVRISDDIVASKCVGEGLIYLWSLSKTLGKKKLGEEVKAEPLMCLEWVSIDTEYLSMAYRDGILGCGDNMGKIYLYNIGPMLNQIHRNKSEEIIRPSRIIEWPDCQITSQRSQEKQMTDVLEAPDPLVINYLAFGGRAEQMVCVTDCNLVCVWKQDTRSAPMEL